MGRSSGSFSGGSRGGGFGGSRGSGMRSGGGRSAGSGRSSGSFSGGRSSSTFSHSRPSKDVFGSYGSRPFSSGSRPNPVRKNPTVTYAPNSYGSGGYGSRSGQRPFSQGGPRVNTGCLYSFILIVVILTLALVIFGGIWSAFFGEQNSGGGDEIAYSTAEREKLPSDAVSVDAGYYTDELGWIESRAALEAGMESFYDSTGVMPYLYLTDTVGGETSPKSNDFINFANSLYNELFTAYNGNVDEAHLLVLFHEFNDGEYTAYYLAGIQAKSVVDDEAGEILLDYIDRYYYDSGKNNSEFFAAAFREAGAAMMRVTRPAWYYPTISAAIALVVFALIGFALYRAKRKKEQALLDKEILNTPLETFGSSDLDKKAEDLAQKYENK